MSFRKRNSGLIGVLIALFLSVQGSATAQERIRERQPPGDAYQPGPVEMYEPCAWTSTDRRGMCLEDRLNLMLELKDGRFKGTGSTCSLSFKGDEEPVTYRCGELLMGLRRGTPPGIMNGIQAASGGRVSGRWEHERMTLVKLRLPPGTERFALFNIVYHPSVLFVDFNRILPETRDP